ncbi:amidase family protein, partial [Mycobacterium leprae]
SGGSAAAVAAGLVPLVTGYEGSGLIRILLILCGVFGLKLQRDRLSLEQHDQAWYGLSVDGPITRLVMDATLFLDAPTTVPGTEVEFMPTAACTIDKLRIALYNQGSDAAR